MKKIFLFLFLSISLFINCFSQKNELKFNIASAIGGFPELNYERLVDDNITFGTAVAASIENAEKMDSRFSIMPYSRLYFGKKKANGFFVEANMAIRNQRDLHYNNIYDSAFNIIGIAKYDKHSTNLGFGAAIGVKLLTKKAAFAELFAGAGRLFGSSPVKEAYFRGGVSIGMRF